MSQYPIITIYTSLQELVPVAAEEDEVVLDEVDEDLPDELAHVHPADHLLEDLQGPVSIEKS